MDHETQRKIEETVMDILKKSNMEDMTEYKVRLQAQEQLGIDLSEIQCKLLVRNVVESFLLSIVERQEKGKEEEPVAPEIVPKKEVKDDGDRVICQLSNNRNVAIHEFNGQTLVSIRQYYEKEGKQLPTPKGISLPTEQWSTLKNNIPGIEEAILRMQRKKSSEHAADKFDAVPDPMPEVTPPKLPSKTIRFVGKNYHVWAHQMEFLLQRFKIAYVLSDQCPTAVLGPESSSRGAARSKAAEQKWKSDDDLCRHMILNSLSDSLFHQYTKKTMSARELWKELKRLYVIEEFGTKRSKVKKYLEFRMVEEKSILKQVEELGNIANSIVSAGMQIDDDFHVSAIISKLPPSWKIFCVKLMHEDHLSLVELIDRLMIEEQLRTQQNSHYSGASSNRGGQHPSSNHISRWGDPRLSSSNRGGQHPSSNHMSKWGDPRLASSNRGGQHHASNHVSKRGDPRLQSLPPRRREWQMEVKTVLCLNCGKEGHISRNCPSRKE